MPANVTALVTESADRDVAFSKGYYVNGETFFVIMKVEHENTRGGMRQSCKRRDKRCGARPFLKDFLFFLQPPDSECVDAALRPFQAGQIPPNVWPMFGKCVKVTGNQWFWGKCSGRRNFGQQVEPSSKLLVNTLLSIQWDFMASPRSDTLALCSVKNDFQTLTVLTSQLRSCLGLNSSAVSEMVGSKNYTSLPLRIQTMELWSCV